MGKVLRIDAHTAMEARGKYARLCILIDINKPLINTILIRRFKQPMTYEGVHRLCFSCGRIGHMVEACLYIVRRDKDQETSVENEQEAVPGMPSEMHENQRLSIDNSTSSPSGITKTDGE